ncbi:MAG: hypothetical protein L0Y67_01885 [Gammaproteobacteria bacterium]|nr:hypothetical protein [Gammaproteobacteria bacterium]MCI0590349.1 hypothetical protein [Gammaproteobacteria bacterium]
MPWKRRYLYLLMLAWAIAWSPKATASEPQATTAPEAPEAAQGNPVDYLKFESRFDSKCQLWQADVRLVKNTHPSKKIHYRMVRYLADKIQPSLIAGTIDPGGEPERLGCTQIDGLPQRWEVVQAQYAD